MKKIIVIIFMLVACRCKTAQIEKPKEVELDWQHYWGSVATPSPADSIAADAQKRSVSIVSAEGACSGGIGSTGVVLTASHCFPAHAENKDIFVNGLKAKVIYNVDKPDGDDMLFLHIYTEDFKPLDFAEPHVDDEIFVVMTQNKYRGVVKRGRIIHVQDDMFFLDVWGIPGCSGSFVYTKDGKLVGMVTQIDASMLKAVSSSKIHAVLLKGVPHVP